MPYSERLAEAYIAQKDKEREQAANAANTGTGGGVEFEHRHDAPPPHPNAKAVGDVVTDSMLGYSGGLIAQGVNKGVQAGSKIIGLSENTGRGLGYAAGNLVDNIIHDGWYNLSPHKDL